MSDKTELLEEYDNLIKVKQRLDFNYFLYMLLVITFIAVFAFPKIYINQQIYYTSRDIAKLQVEYETLQEENKLIKSSVESIKFKNQVLDTMF
ncbi:hypothetical protein [Sulfurimonas sp. C5]|uniref:hypothetical protein n=1 Tax=Sulfurimonas sp. C5 TaxID=3036947 RepID=UPI002453F487|nr:hypothetical protein [Sulfurimonas sp. C5]MDH4943687.1 hypothetical protein [Sulfurimonas sp. C5]